MDSIGTLLSELQQKVADSHNTSECSGSVVESLREEVAILTDRIKTLQDSFQAKNKEINTLREQILVSSGALQGMQHILKKHALD